MKKYSVLFVVLLLGIFSVQAESKSVEAMAIIPEPEITRWGYRTVGTEQIEQSDWYRSQFGSAKIRTQRIRSLTEVPGEPKTFYRFTITEERYDSARTAAMRLRRLLDVPANTNTKMSPELILRKGLQENGRVIIVSTDVLLFSNPPLSG